MWTALVGEVCLLAPLETQSLSFALGAIVPVAPGQMRNKWYPRRIADYVTATELKPLERSNVLVERDFGFTKAGSKSRKSTQVSEETAARSVAAPAPAGNVRLDLLSVGSPTVTTQYHDAAMPIPLTH